MAATRLKTRADPTGTAPLWGVPAGRKWAGASVNRYGGGMVTVANPHLVPPIGQGMPGADALLPGDSSLTGGVPGLPGTSGSDAISAGADTGIRPRVEDDALPISPDIEPVTPPENPTLSMPADAGTSEADNIIPFDEGADQFGPPMPDTGDQIAMESARFAQQIAYDNAELDAAEAELDALFNPPEQGNAPASPSTVTPRTGRAPESPTRLSAFTGFTKEPITFGGPNAWKSGDEVGFNDSEVQRQNPAWTGSRSWTPQANSMKGPYKTMGTADPQSTRDQTQRFYQRAAIRGDTGRVNRYNARAARSNL